MHCHERKLSLLVFASLVLLVHLQCLEARIAYVLFVQKYLSVCALKETACFDLTLRHQNTLEYPVKYLNNLKSV